MEGPNKGAPEIKNSNEEGKNIEFLKVSKILDGKGAESLASSALCFELKTGDRLTASTYEGVNYDRPWNEDRVAVSPLHNFVAVVDGVGQGVSIGPEMSGEVAAKCLAESLLEHPTNVNLAIEKARVRMIESNAASGAAVFISAELRSGWMDRKFLKVFQCGDAKLIVIRKDGKLSFVSKDESLVQDLLDAKKITPDEALYHPRREVLDNPVSSEYPSKPKSYEVTVKTGYLVLLMSDGVSDNITPGEIAEKAREGMSASQLFSWLSDVTGQRMRDVDKIKGKSPSKHIMSPEQVDRLEQRKKTGVYSDGFRSEPKPDNLSLAILEVK